MNIIGRAEPEVKLILTELLSPELIRTQVPLHTVISPGEYSLLDKEIKQHKFDMVVYRENQPKLIVEVNYKHGEKAAIKWRRIFSPMIKKLKNPCAIPVTIDDYECLTLFKHTKTNHTKLRKSDYQDVINALQLAGVSVNFIIPECN